MAAHGARQLAHGFKQSGLRFGRRAIDLVGEQDIGKNRAGHKRPCPMAGSGIFLDNVGSGNVGGHQVGRELDAVELQPQGLGHGAYQQCLSRARQAGQEAVAADKQ